MELGFLSDRVDIVVCLGFGWWGILLLIVVCSLYKMNVDMRYVVVGWRFVNKCGKWDICL